MTLLDSATGIGARLARMTQSRLALVGLDLEQAMWRAAIVSAITLAIASLAIFASVFGAVAFVVHHWSANAVWALLVVCASYLVLATALAAGLYHWAGRAPFLMRDSIDTLRQDARTLMGPR